MKKLGLSAHFFYRFPILYGGLILMSALAWRGAASGGISLVSSIIALLFTLVFLYSASRLWIIYEKRESLYEGDKTLKEKALYLWKRGDVRVLFLLLLLLPYPFPALTPLIGAFGTFTHYLLSRLLFPFFVLSFLLGALTGLTFYEKNEKKKELRKKFRRSPFLFFFHVFKYIPIYAVAAYFLLSLTVVLFSIPGMVVLFLTTGLGIAVIVTLALLWSIRILRALRIRRRFLAQLKDACTARGIPLPKIDAPIRSLFKIKEKSPIFTITVGERKYACRVIGTLKPHTIHRFYPSGEIGHVRATYMRFNLRAATFGGGVLYRQRAELYETRIPIAFDAEEGYAKIFIFNPCSKIVEGQYGNDCIPLDNGMKIGEYTFYTASGFTNALKRDCLHKRANE